MGRGTYIVEQIQKDGAIVKDYDEIYSSNQLIDIIKQYFKVVFIENKTLVADFNNNTFAIYVKNVSYLGNPHPDFKKRVQLGKTFKDKCDYFKNRGIPMIILGIYHYGNNLVFVDFNNEKYSNNKSNNSSAHVLTSDIQIATIKGYYSKIDARENKVTCFTSDNISKFLKIKFGEDKDNIRSIVSICDDFFKTLSLEWNGIECYKEMFKANYAKKREAEWPGFYLEYKFENYISYNHLLNVAQAYQDKSQDGIDLDLYFPEIQSFGDLKCHSKNSSSILGNKKSTIFKVLKTGSIYYIVLEHDTIKDSEMDYSTTIYWNTLLNKKNKMSYSTKMKGKVSLLNYKILEINKYNIRFLTDFQTNFKNSNGKKRDTKISIKNRDISNFVIYKKNLRKL